MSLSKWINLTVNNRQINENMQKHLENLDGLEKNTLPEKLSRKCKEYSKNLLKNKVDKVLQKLGR